MDSPGGAISPDEAFSLLGNDVRLAILRAVWAADADTLSFSDIRARVGNPDSGRFNYHLNQLEGHLLEKRSDKYGLTQAGREVVRAVMAGTLTRQPPTESAEIEGDCDECGGSLVTRYADRYRVECGECGNTVMWNEFPPAGLDDRTPAEAATAFDRWTRSRFRLAMAGVCPNCAAAMETALVESADPEELSTEHHCPNCRYEARVPLDGHVLYHPAVVGWLYEEGIAIDDMPYWEARRLVDDISVEISTADPWRATTVVTISGHSVAVTLDDTLSIVDVDCRPS